MAEDNETSDLHADLTAAFAESAAEAPAPDPTPSAEAPAPPEQHLDGPAEGESRVRDDKGRFAPLKADKPADAESVKLGAIAPKEASQVPAKVGEQPPAEAAPKAPQTEPIKAPQSWKPAARESWAKAPPEIQQEVARREKEISIALQESSEARQAYQKFREMTGPYEHMFRAERVDAFQATQNLLQTAAALATAPAAHKAQIVANIIKTYGVDIQTLASALDGASPPQGGQPQYQQPMQLPPNVQSALSKIEQWEQRQAQTVQQQAEAAISEVQGLEFFEDVKDEMADLLELAAKRNLPLTPKEAYNRAVWANPDTAKVLEQRRAAQAAANPQGSTQRSRTAASSVRSTPAASMDDAQPKDLRETIRAAMDSMNNR